METLRDVGQPWIGVDLDGTLAELDKYISPTHIGDPIPAMVDRVTAWLLEGKTVKIFTARASGSFCRACGVRSTVIRREIKKWCKLHIGEELPITCVKDHLMVELYDDISLKQVERNTGRLL